MPGTVLGTVDTAVEKTGQIPSCVFCGSLDVGGKTVSMWCDVIGLHFKMEEPIKNNSKRTVNGMQCGDWEGLRSLHLRRDVQAGSEVWEYLGKQYSKQGKQKQDPEETKWVWFVPRIEGS